MQASATRRYRILDVLGSGGFGTVYRAEMITPAGLRREVALKVLNERAAADKEAAARLRDEARILSNLNYVGIVRVDDLIMLQGRWTMVMELVHGVDLERLVGQFGPLPPTVALDVVASVARTLVAAGQARDSRGQPLSLIHRDVKPANILVTTSGGTKLLDFGVARAQLSDREAATQKAVVMGSLPYLAPERFGFEDTPAGDVYALGAVFYEMLSGERFGRTHLSEQRHREKLREALHTAWGVMHEEGREPVLRFCARLLAFDAQRRPEAREVAQTAEEIRRTLHMPGLSSWADRRVTEALKGRGPSDKDPLCGEVLTEVSSSDTLAGQEPEPDLTIAEAAPQALLRLRRQFDEEPDPETELMDRSMAQALAEGGPLLSSGRDLSPSGGFSVVDERGFPEEPLPSEGSITDGLPPPPVRPSGRAGRSPVPKGRSKRASSRTRTTLVFLMAAFMGVVIALGGLAWFKWSGRAAPSPDAPKRFTLDDVAGLPLEPGDEALAEPESPSEAPPGAATSDVATQGPSPSGAGAPDATPPGPPSPEAPPSGAVTPSSGSPWSKPPALAPETDEDDGLSVRSPWGDVKPTAAGSTSALGPKGMVLVLGDIDHAQLLGADGEKVFAGPVEPGTYTVFPSFPGGYTVRGPTLTVLDGQTLVVRCDAATRSCSEAQLER